MHSNVSRNRRAAVVYGLVVGVVLTACLWLAIACDCTARQTVAITLAGFLVASVVVGTVLR
jgi:hypothetical protein